MEDEESIIITIAEAEGWTECRSVIKGAGGWPRTPTAHGKPPNRKYEAECPRYTRDLNAMHHVEINMPIEKKRPYAMFLAQLLNTHPTIDLDDQFLNITATALQRAKAFLRTLGKWGERTGRESLQVAATTEESSVDREEVQG